MIATTPTRQKWEGRWEQLLGSVKRLWGGLIRDELLMAEGENDRRLGAHKEHVGTSREEFEELLDRQSSA
jgi:uncharacterized protein YjbJ (UPF0337 family)